MSCVCTRTAPSAALRSYTQIEYSKSGEGRTTMRERQVGRGACRMVLMPASFVILAIVRSMIRRGRKNTLTRCTTTATSSVAAIISSFGRSFADCLLDDGQRDVRGVGDRCGLRIVESDRYAQAFSGHWNPVTFDLCFRQRERRCSIGPARYRVHRDRIAIGGVRHQEIVGTEGGDAPPAPLLCCLR